MDDSSGTTSYSYDDAGDVISVTDSNGKTVSYGYNTSGQQVCLSYPGFANNCNSSGAGSNDPPAGDVTYDYDQQGRLSSVVDWNGDAFTYAYDCNGGVAWMAETPSDDMPSVSPCEGSSGTVPSEPTPPSGTTYVITSDNYSSGSTGNALQSIETTANMHTSSSPLISFGSSSNVLAFNQSNELSGSTPYLSGTASSEDSFSYDSQQRVTSGPETASSASGYSYVNSSGTPPFRSTNTVDQMGLDSAPLQGSTAQLGAEYDGSGALCWVAMNPTSSSGTCASPSSSASAYETFAYNASRERTGSTSVGGFGNDSALVWNQDTGTLSCINTSGTTCSAPSSATPEAATYTYNGDGLRMSASTWSTASSSVETNQFTWDSLQDSLLSNGQEDYIYGLSSYEPIAQIDAATSVTSEFVADPSSNVRGLVQLEGSPSYQLVNYTDYDAYGTPITASGGSLYSGGLSNDGVSGDADSATSFGFGSGYQDSTGLIYLVNRYYDPGTGEFLSIDPDLSSTGAPYQYAGDNSVSNVDPTGLDICEDLGSADGVCGGADGILGRDGWDGGGGGGLGVIGGGGGDGIPYGYAPDIVQTNSQGIQWLEHYYDRYVKTPIRNVTQLTKDIVSRISSFVSNGALRANDNRAVFYTGNDFDATGATTFGAGSAAQAYATGINGETIDMVLVRLGIVMPKWDDTKAWVVNLWKSASALFALSVKSRTRAFAVVGMRARPGSVFFHVELPILFAKQVKVLFLSPTWVCTHYPCNNIPGP